MAHFFLLISFLIFPNVTALDEFLDSVTQPCCYSILFIARYTRGREQRRTHAHTYLYVLETLFNTCRIVSLLRSNFLADTIYA